MRFAHLAAVTLVGLAAQHALAGMLTYTAVSGPLNYGPPGPGGQYTIGGVTTQFSQNAILTLTATADSSTVVSGTSSADSGSMPFYYNLVGTVGITIVDGSTTRSFTAGTQAGTYQLAVISARDSGSSYSLIGFGVVDTTTGPYTATAPQMAGFGYSLVGGTSFYGNHLASPGVFNGGAVFVLTSLMEVASGSQSGQISFYSTSNSGMSFSISAVPAPGAIALLGIAGLAGRRRRG